MSYLANNFKSNNISDSIVCSLLRLLVGDQLQGHCLHFSMVWGKNSGSYHSPVQKIVWVFTKQGMRSKLFVYTILSIYSSVIHHVSSITSVCKALFHGISTSYLSPSFSSMVSSPLEIFAVLLYICQNSTCQAAVAKDPTISITLLYQRLIFLFHSFLGSHCRSATAQLHCQQSEQKGEEGMVTHTLVLTASTQEQHSHFH